MDTNLLSELTKDQPERTPEEQYLWLFRIHEACANAPQPSVRLIAEPLGKALGVVKGLGEKASDAAKKDAGEKIAALLLQCRVLMIFCFLEELNRFRNVIAAETAQLKKGTAQRKKAETLQATYERTIDALAMAYDQLRHGKTERLDEASRLLEEARRITLELKK